MKRWNPSHRKGRKVGELPVPVTQVSKTMALVQKSKKARAQLSVWRSKGEPDKRLALLRRLHANRV